MVKKINVEIIIIGFVKNFFKILIIKIFGLLVMLLVDLGFWEGIIFVIDLEFNLYFLLNFKEFISCF